MSLNLTAINNLIDRMRGRTLSFFSRGNQMWHRVALFLAVIGPGIITSNVDNDAGGIATYTQAGSAYGYAMLWSLVPMTIALYVTMEMCARMGVITGKGLSDLIREEFGFRSTFFVMIVGFLVDLGNVVAEFAGVAASAEIFGVSKYVAVPLAAVLVWVLVLKGTYRQVEVVFLVACVFYLTYLFSAIFFASGLAASGADDHCAFDSFGYGLSDNADGIGGNNDCSVAVLLFAGGICGKESGATAIPPGAIGCLVWEHQLHGDCVLHRHLHGGNAACFRVDQYYRCGGSGKGVGTAGGKVGCVDVCVWVAERFDVCGNDPAAIDGSRDL